MTDILGSLERHTPDIAFLITCGIIGNIFGAVLDYSWDGEFDYNHFEPNLSTVAGSVVGGLVLKNAKN